MTKANPQSEHKNKMLTCFIILVSLFANPITLRAQQVYFTTGFKVSEVTPTAAIVWTRLCSQEKPNPVVHARQESVFRHPLKFNEMMPLAKMDGGVKGAPGFVRIILSQGKTRFKSDWLPVAAKDDFTAKALFNKLKPGQCYEVLLEAKATANATANTVQGRFCTPPPKNAVVPVSFTSSTCQYFWSFDDEQRGFKTYDSMKKLKPAFYLQTGDYVYYDKPGPLATTPDKARHKWHAMDAWPALKEFYETTAAYFLKDDHDLLADDASPASAPYGTLQYKEGLAIWQENVPLREKSYRTFRWGKDLQIWLMEGREFRSDKQKETEKTIWGTDQKAWLTKTMQASDASFKLIISPTPIVGPDRDNKSDNHANKIYDQEGNWVRKFLATQNNTFVICGDRHWQYVSTDAETGLMEFGSGPVSDYHAQGWPPNDKRPEHKFLRVKGGFIGVQVDREQGKPFIQFTHYDVNGHVVNEEKIRMK